MSQEALEGIVLPPNLDQRLRVIATSIRYVKQQDAMLMMLASHFYMAL